MKNILFALLAIISCCTCTARDNNVIKNGNDTVVCNMQLSSMFAPFEENEYFVVANCDTSAYSFLFSKSEVGGIRMKIFFMVNEKMFKILSSKEDNDKTATGGIREGPRSVFYSPNYKGLLRELELCLNEASKVYDLKRFESIVCRLVDLSDIAVLTNYETIPQAGTAYYQNYEKVKNALYNTSFKKDINHILNQYGVEVEKLSLQESLGYIDKKAFLSSQNITKGLKVPDYFFDTEVYITLDKK